MGREGREGKGGGKKQQLASCLTSTTNIPAHTLVQRGSGEGGEEASTSILPYQYHQRPCTHTCAEGK